MNTKAVLERISMIILFGIAAVLFVIGIILISSGDDSAYSIGVLLVLVGVASVLAHYLIRWVIRQF
jgi:hypothetical protein